MFIPVPFVGALVAKHHVAVAWLLVLRRRILITRVVHDRRRGVCIESKMRMCVKGTKPSQPGMKRRLTNR